MFDFNPLKLSAFSSEQLSDLPRKILAEAASGLAAQSKGLVLMLR